MSLSRPISLDDATSSSYSSDRPSAFVRLQEMVTEQIIKELKITNTVDNIVGIANLSTNVVSIITSTFLACAGNKKSSGDKVCIWFNLLTNLSACIMNFTNLITRMCDKFDFNRVKLVVSQWISELTDTDDIPDLILLETRNFGNTESHASFSKYMSIGLSILSYMIAIGFSATNTPVAKFNQIIKFRQEIARSGRDASEELIDLLDDLKFTDLRGMNGQLDALQKLVDRCSIVRQYQMSDIINKPHFRQEFEECRRAIMEEVAKRLDKEQQVRMQPLRQYLCTQLVHLDAMEQAVANYRKTGPRQTTVGFSLEGEPGIGKSTLATYILEKISKKLNYNKAIYNPKLTSSKRFTSCYSGEDVAVFNEFQNVRGPDPNIIDLNSLLSSDPMEFESATLDSKNVPCRLKVCCLTANQPNYDFKETIREQTNIALVSRILRYEVEDPLYEHNDRYKSYTHRNPDFSHLKIFKLVCNNASPNNVHEAVSCDKVEMSVDTMITELVAIIKDQEIAHLRGKMTHALETENKEMIETITKRLEMLQDSANSGTTNFFVIRLQGPTNTYKTTTALDIARRIKSVYGFNLVTFNETKLERKLDFISTEPRVLLFDDVDLCKYSFEYLELVNQQPAGTLIIVTSNTVIPYEPLPRDSVMAIKSSAIQSFQTNDGFSFAPSNCLSLVCNLFRKKDICCYRVDKTPYKEFLIEGQQTSGLIRRFGFDDSILIKPNMLTIASLYTPPKNSGIVISTTKSAKVTILGEEFNISSAADLALEKYTDYLRSGGTLNFTNAIAPSVIPDIVITVKDLKAFIRESQTISGYTDMFFRKDHPAGTVSANPTLYDKLLAKVPIEDWAMPNDLNEDSFDVVVMVLASKLKAVVPSATVKFVSKDVTLLCHENLIYKETENRLFGRILVDNCNLKLLNRAGDFTLVHPSMIVDLVLFGDKFMTDPKLAAFSFKTVYLLRNSIDDILLNNDDLVLYRIALQNARKELAIKNSGYSKWAAFIDFVKNSSAILRVVSILTGIISSIFAIYSAYKFIQWLSTTSHSTVNSYVDDNDPHMYYNDYVSKVMDGTVRNRQEYTQLLKTGGVNTSGIEMINAGIDKIRFQLSDAESQKNLETVVHEILLTCVLPENYKLIPGVIRLVEATPDLYKSPRVFELCSQLRTLSTSHLIAVEKEKTPDQMVSVLNKLENGLVRIHATGKCYGLAYKDNRILTVSHIFEKNSQQCFVEHNGKVYPAQVLFLSRNRDIAIVIVKDKTFPKMRDITSDFYSAGPFNHKSMPAFFCRPTQGSRVVVPGHASYFNVAMVARHDTTNKFYSPKDYVMFNDISFGFANKIFAKGDCGLPLIVANGDSYKVIGIYNGYAHGDQSYIFSHLMGWSLSKFESLVMDESHCDKEPVEPNKLAMQIFKESIVNIPDYNSLFEEIDTEFELFDPSTHNVPFVGYLKKMKTYKQPTLQKDLLRSPDCELPVLTKPSYMNARYIPPEKRDLFPRTLAGKVSPLFNEVKKMFDKPGFHADQKLWKQAIDITINRHKAQYPKCNPIRLHEVINGRPSTNMHAMVLDTSAGPYSKYKHKLMDKLNYFVNKAPTTTNMPQYIIDLDNPKAVELKRDYYLAIDYLLAGIKILHVSQDCPKVELLALDKDKVRLFNACDVVFNMALKTFFAEILLGFGDFHSTSPIKFGSNPYVSNHWWRRQVPDEWKNFCSDLKGQDKSFTSEMFDACCDVFCANVTTEAHKVAIRTIFESFKTGIHIYDGMIYPATCNTSGNYITNPLDSVSVEITEAYAFLRMIQEKYPETDLEDVDKYFMDANILLAICGDDTARRFNPDLDINFEDYKRYYHEVGFTLTESKDNETDLNFCSRDIVKCPLTKIYVSPLKLSAVTSPLFWVKKNKLSILPEQYMQVVLEASLHEEKVYDQIMSDLRKQMKYIGLPSSSVVIPSWTKQRRHHAKYVNGLVRSPLVTGEDTNFLDLSYCRNMPNIVRINYVGMYNEFRGKDKNVGDISVEFCREIESRIWICTATDSGSTYTGRGISKQEAKQDAFSQICIRYDLCENLGNTISQASTEDIDCSRFVNTNLLPNARCASDECYIRNSMKMFLELFAKSVYSLDDFKKYNRSNTFYLKNPLVEDQYIRLEGLPCIAIECNIVLFVDFIRAFNNDFKFFIQLEDGTIEWHVIPAEEGDFTLFYSNYIETIFTFCRQQAIKLNFEELPKNDCLYYKFSMHARSPKRHIERDIRNHFDELTTITDFNDYEEYPFESVVRSELVPFVERLLDDYELERMHPDDLIYLEQWFKERIDKHVFVKFREDLIKFFPVIFIQSSHNMRYERLKSWSRFYCTDRSQICYAWTTRLEDAFYDLYWDMTTFSHKDLSSQRAYINQNVTPLFFLNNYDYEFSSFT